MQFRSEVREVCLGNPSSKPSCLALYIGQETNIISYYRPTRDERILILNQTLISISPIDTMTKNDTVKYASEDAGDEVSADSASPLKEQSLK